MNNYALEDLEVYQAARAFRKKLYALVKRLPPEEKFNLSSQMRRAALSLTNNIAEGHGRFHYQETIQYIRQFRGSLEELIDDLNTCMDERYIGEEEVEVLKTESNELLRRLNGYIAYLKKQKSDQVS
jgi:four helix bundle protein